MKKIILYGLLIVLFGCESEFKLYDNSDTVPIAYCILDPREDIQTIRLTKTFLGEEKATQADSSELLYYQTEVDLAIEILESGIAIDQTKFYPVNVEKDSGHFLTDYHIVYKAYMPVKQNTEYRLVVHVHEDDRLIYSTTSTPGNFRIIDPAYPDFRTINIQPDHNPAFHWTLAKSAGIYQLSFVIHYFELDSTDSQLKSEDISLRLVSKSGDPGTEFSAAVNSTQFFIRLGEALEPNEQLIRSFHSLDAYIVAGGEEFDHYYRNQTQGNSFNLTEYSNIENGMGLFSSISHAIVRGFKISGQTLDSLAYGTYTRHLNFLDRHGNRKTQ